MGIVCSLSGLVQFVEWKGIWQVRKYWLSCFEDSFVGFCQVEVQVCFFNVVVMIEDIVMYDVEQYVGEVVGILEFICCYL